MVIVSNFEKYLSRYLIEYVFLNSFKTWQRDSTVTLKPFLIYYES